jgi:2-keto-3-deoxy-6-phosphogluconate aldolase
VHLQYLKNEVVAFLVIKTLEGLESKIESLVSKGYKILDVNFRTKCALHAIQFIKKQFSELKVGASTN